MTARVIAMVAGLALAAVLGVSDAPNASAALIAARAGSYPLIVAWSATWHLLGGLLTGSAVAATVVELVRVPTAMLAPALAAGCLASVGFTWIGTRHGIPASASVGLVGGLSGAGLAANGWHGVDWGSLSGLAPRRRAPASPSGSSSRTAARNLGRGRARPPRPRRAAVSPGRERDATGDR